MQHQCLSRHGVHIQGGPAKVRPTYIFAGNIILVTFECIGKIQCFFGKCDDSLNTHFGKRKNLICNIVRQMAKNHRILPVHSNFTSKVGLTLARPPCIQHTCILLEDMQVVGKTMERKPS